jgi:MerR family transcriptional regulator, light-induced transcriptional regulator
VATYSIKDLEQLSGIRAHTIRIWEQRYGLIQPSRTKTNIRYYRDEELKLLINIAILNRNGYKISKIADLTPETINLTAESLSQTTSPDNENQLDSLILSMISLDEQKFDQVVNATIAEHGFENTMANLINPFLERLSLLWFTASIKPAQDNFMSCRLRQKLCSAIDSLPPSNITAKKILMLLPEGDTTELPLLFAYYLARQQHLKVIYLGCNNSIQDIAEAQAICKSDHVFIFLSVSFTGNLQTYVTKLADVMPTSHFLLTGYHAGLQSVRLPKQFTLLYSQVDTVEYFSSISE